MRRVSVLLGILLLTTVALAVTSVPPFPKTLINARYVYVTSYDGDQFDLNLLQEDRQAISNVQEAIRQWGRYIVVFRPEEAEIILRVQSRGSEDVLAVYDAHNPGSNFLWRVMGRGGLQQGETPLVTQLRQAVEKVSK
jgi:hypothetical protein